MRITGKNLIGFEWSAQSADTFQAYNPSSATFLPEEFHNATSSETERALQLAAKCYPVYSKLSPERRAAFLEAVCQEIINLGDTLLERAHVETGLPITRLRNERERTIKQISQFAALLKEGSWVNATIDTQTPFSLRKMYIPLGAVAVFGSSNFPFAYSVAGVDTGPALAAGCPVIVKAHPAHPGVSELTAAAILKAAQHTNMPEGVFSLLFDKGYAVAAQIVKHPVIKAVAFTGSQRGGMALHTLANERKDPIPVYAEMGSINPIVLLPEALKQNGAAIAAQIANSITTNGGQFCTKPGLIFALEGPELDQFLNYFQEQFSQTQPAPLLTKGIFENFVRLSDEATGLGAVTQQAVSTVVMDGENTAVPLFAQTDVATFLDNPMLKEEIFGPYSLLVTAKSLKLLKEAVLSLQGQLTASVFMTPDEWEEGGGMLALLQERAGRVIMNGVPTGVEVRTSMHHGGPFPATTYPFFTSVGKDSILRFVRPQTFQNWPEELLPGELQNSNPFGIMRRVNDQWTSAPVSTT